MKAALNFLSWIFLFGYWILPVSAQPKQVSGIYPHLTMYNNESECGTGAVVPWADRLWVITYGPHLPRGSSDKLYSISADLEQTIHPESIGGTPANRMIHKESQQLFIGPYAIDASGKVLAIPYSRMPGRHTGNARHLTDPANKIYYATMEEGLYTIDVKTLKVVEHLIDGNFRKGVGDGIKSRLPGYHGKGLYSGYGSVIYANNGERGKNVKTDPTVPSGALGQWFGKGDLQLVRRNQFTEVTGPGGIYGNPNPDTDPVWAVGWDFRSLILMLLENGKWHAYRLPKSSHSYDGAHGWNTEWPRIRDIGEDDLMMTMHGCFWRFPGNFGTRTSAGIKPRSNYLKVIGDFCRWGDRVVLGCDDSAKKEFLNHRPFKSTKGAPGQSNSNLWFVSPDKLDKLGPPIGRGSVWLRDDVTADEPSDPFLFSGYDHRMIQLSHATGSSVTFTLEVDRQGNGTWTTLRSIDIPANGAKHHIFTESETGEWVRIRADKAAARVNAHFHYRNRDPRSTKSDTMFAGMATVGNPKAIGGVMRCLGSNKRTMGMITVDRESGAPGAYYELDADLNLTKSDDAAGKAFVADAVSPAAVFKVDAASVILVEDGKRYRIPKGVGYGAEAGGGLNVARVCREVATERDLFNCHGTFYELPARNAQGFAKIRPVASHNLAIHDYCSYRGMMMLTGISHAVLKAGNEHIIASDDGKAAVWTGVIDDLWKLGKPRGRGGPWKDSSVKANLPSDAYLMTAYDKKSMVLSHAGADAIEFQVEVDIDGTGLWVPYQTFQVQAGKETAHQFPDEFSAYWVRVKAGKSCTATAWFVYK
jgi:hypothetical protein